MLSWLLAVALAVPPSAPVQESAPPLGAPAHLEVNTPLEAPAPPEVPAPLQVPAPEQVMAVPDDLRSRLRDALPTHGGTPRERLDRLVAFLSDDSGMGLHYRDDATLTVAQADVVRQANCLTYTMAFLALAPLVGLDAYPQEISQTLTWYQQANTVYRTSHVNAAVRIGRSTLVVDVSGDALIARDEPFAITQERLVSHYYNNLAIMLLARGDARNAAVFSAKALALYPDHPDHWSNAGVIHARNGDLPAAARAYAKALELDPRNASALLNAIGLAQRIDDKASEASLRERLARVEQRDPFHQFLSALEYEHQGQMTQAIAHFRRAIRLHPREHRFHAALARACLAAGDRRCATGALARARATANGTARADYGAQLEALRAAAVEPRGSGGGGQRPR